MASITCLASCLHNFYLSTHLIVYPSFLWTYLGLRLTAQEPLGWALSQQHRGLTQIPQHTLLKEELIQYQMHQTAGKRDIINCCTGKQPRISQNTNKRKTKKTYLAGDKWTKRFSSRGVCVCARVRACVCMCAINQGRVNERVCGTQNPSSCREALTCWMILIKLPPI